MTVSTAILPDPLWCLVEFCCVYRCCSFHEYMYLCSDLTGSGNTARNEAFVMKLCLQGAAAATPRSCPSVHLQCLDPTSNAPEQEFSQGVLQPAVLPPGLSKHLITRSQHWQTQMGISRELPQGSPQLHCGCRSCQGVQGCVVYGSSERWCYGTAQFCHTQPHKI